MSTNSRSGLVSLWLTLLKARKKPVTLLLGIPFIALLYFTWSMRTTYKNESTESLVKLPLDLEDIVLQRFDDLAGKKELLYGPSEPEHFTDDGFELEIRVTPALKEKPITPPDDPGRSKAGGPFINPAPSEVITSVGKYHQLLLNKFSVYRPMLVLPTIEYVTQTSNLDISDFKAAWAVMEAMRTEQLVIYNCGVNSGSSQGHKHLQILPKPDPNAFVLWPSKATSSEDVTKDIENIPFRHFVLRLSPHTNANEVYERYRKLLHPTIRALEAAGQTLDYNLVMTKEWIALIPRSKAEWGGPFGANALGMLGMVSVRDEEEKDQWAKLGWKAHLRELGVPKDV